VSLLCDPGNPKNPKNPKIQKIFLTRIQKFQPYREEPTTIREIPVAKQLFHIVV
jgi:hypothetical protein